MQFIRPVPEKSQKQIMTEWDQIAEVRSEQIRTGKDLSFDFVLKPTLLSLVGQCAFDSVIDVGCGCGLLTLEFAKFAKKVTGVDLSSKSIWVAERNAREQFQDIAFVQSAIEDYFLSPGERPYTLAVANMSLMSMLNLDTGLSAIARLLSPGGHFAFTITHPCFWPRYWQYSEEWFAYGNETVIEAPFHISLDEEGEFVTTHVHRPIERYVEALAKAGFHICQLREPMPPAPIEARYPQRWEYPRFLAALCIRT